MKSILTKLVLTHFILAIRGLSEICHIMGL